LFLVIYALGLALLALSGPRHPVDPHVIHFAIIVGVVGLWRYSWGALHFIRSLIFRYVVYPRLCRRIGRDSDVHRPPHVFLLITSFRIDTETTRRVYKAAIDEAIACGSPATIVASIVEQADQRLIKALFAQANAPASVKLVFVRIPGSGKRDALAVGFRAISRCGPAVPGAIVAVIDGDSIIPAGLVRRCAPFFNANPRLGALTTDENCEVTGDYPVYRQWYTMRFAQRHILMSSVSLSRRVLTLTGRMSMFRAEIICNPSFINEVEADYIDHWRLGRFRFLTGDDKTTWYWLLRNRWEMMYVPDVQVVTIETPPHQNFFVGATMLMTRWFGNMLRTNARALAVPRKAMGNFVWWCLIDQRLSMWTSPMGLAMAIAGSAVKGVEILWFYFLWIGLTRLVQTLLLLSARQHVSAAYPFLLYFNQVYGSLIKIYMLCHLNKQKWTRQNTTFSVDLARFRQLMGVWASDIFFASYLAIFIVAALFMNGLLAAADLRRFFG
jgi:glycosyltransferase Alg8